MATPSTELNIKGGRLATFLELSCHQIDRGTVVISKSSLLDLLQKYLGHSQQRSSFARRLGRFIQGNSNIVQFQGRSPCERISSVWYHIDIVPQVLRHFNLSLGDLAWALVKQRLESKSASTKSFPVVNTSAPDLLTESSNPELSGVVASAAETPAETRGRLKRPRVEHEQAELDESQQRLQIQRTTSFLTSSGPSPTELQRSGSGAFSEATGLESCGASSTVGLDHASVNLDGQGDDRAEDILEAYKKQFAGASRDDLLKEIALRDQKLALAARDATRNDRTIGRLRHKMKLEKQRVRRHLHNLEKKSKSTKAFGENETLEQRMAIARKGKTGRYLTVPSKVSLAIRRNLSNAACADVSLILLDDTSRFTVARSEVQAGSSVQAAAQAFHEQMAEAMASGRVISFHMVTQDATNSSIIQKKKLCALLLHSAYVAEDVLNSALHSGRGFTFSWNKLFRSVQCVGDVQPVEDGSASGSVALTTKMLQSIGCPDIQSLVTLYADAADADRKVLPTPDHQSAAGSGKLGQRAMLPRTARSCRKFWCAW